MRHLVILLLFISFATPVQAKSKQQDFVSTQRQILEAEVRGRVDLQQLAKDISDLKGYEVWPEDKDADRLLYIAIQWMDQHHYNSSAALLNRINPKLTNGDLWRYYQSLALIQKGKFIPVAGYVAALEQNYPKDPEVLYLKSTFLAESNDLVGALEVMNRLIKKNKKMGKAYLQRGIFNMLAFSNDQAIEDFRKAIKYLPEDQKLNRQQAYLQIGLIYWKIKMNQEKAKKFLSKGVDIDPNSELVRQVQQALRRPI